MEKQKIVDFDFKKIIPTEGSVIEKKVSKIVTKKFLLLSFVVALGFGLSSQMYQNYYNKKEQNQILSIQNQKDKQVEFYQIAKDNKEAIVLNLEQQITIYDDMVQDILDANKKVPNSAKTILTQNNNIRTLSQSYKKSITQLINNFNNLVSSENNFNKASVEERAELVELVKNYQIGSLNRDSEFEDILISYTTVNNDEKGIRDKALPIRAELKTKIIDKMSNLLGSNEITRYKKIKIKN